MIFGIQQCLGKCVGIIGMNMLGPKFSINEESGHGVRMKIFDAAMTYCLDRTNQIVSSSIASGVRAEPVYRSSKVSLLGPCWTYTSTISELCVRRLS